MEVSKRYNHHIGKIGLNLFFVKGDRKVISDQSNLLTYLYKALLVEGMEKRHLDIKMARVQSELKFVVC